MGGLRRHYKNENSTPTKHTSPKSAPKVMIHGTAFASGSVCLIQHRKREQ
jgi:hypothetical protein